MFESLGQALKGSMDSLGGLLKTAAETATPLVGQYLNFEQVKTTNNQAYKLAQQQTAKNPAGTGAGLSTKTLLIGGGVLLAVVGVAVVAGRR